MSLVGVSGAVLPPSMNLPRWESHAIERDVLLLPDILLRDFDEPLDDLMRPAFDCFSQSFGRPKSPSYDNDGIRKGTRFNIQR